MGHDVSSLGRNRDEKAGQTFIKSWHDEAVGGLAAALFVIPAVLGCGVIVFQPLGSQYQAMGIQAAFAATIAAAAFRGLFAGRSLHVNAPRATQAALLAGLLIEATQRATAGGHILDTHVLIAIPALALAAGAVLQLLLGLLRWGDALKFVPQPVVAGFVNGFALVILWQQLPNLLGVADAAALSLSAVNVLALGLAVLTAAGAWLLRRRLSAIPVPLVGLAAGAVLYRILAPLTGGAALGPTVKAPPMGLPFDPTVDSLIVLVGHPLLTAMAPSILVTGLTLGIVSSIQSLLSAAVADSLLHARHDSNRELAAQGGANLLSALLGGTVTGGSPLYTRVAIHNGARTDRANLFLGAVLLAAALGLGPLLEMVPLSVMAAMVMITVLRPDDWTSRLISQLRNGQAGVARAELWQNLGIMVTVAALVAASDVLVALGVGMGLSVMVYLRRAAVSVVRRSYYGDRVHSHTGRSSADTDLLERHGAAIAIMELHGPVFFGSAENLARAAEAMMTRADTLILDLSRVNDVETTGVLVLRRLDERLKQEGKTLLLAGLWKGRGLRALMRDMGFDKPEAEGRLFPELETALSLAEDRLLTRLAGGEDAEAELPLCDHPSVQGLTQAQFDLLSLTTRRLVYAAGDRILAEGSADNSQFFLVKGRVRVEKRSAETGHAVRIGSIRAGAIFGEMAMLTGEPRSADVVADSPVVCHELTAEDVAMLDSLDPAISFILVRNIAKEVTVKIARLSRAVTMSEA